MKAPAITPDPTPDAIFSPAAQAYQVIGLAAVVVLGAALYQYGADRWSLVPVLVGAAGLAFRWRTAPPACLVAVAFAIIARSWVGNAFDFRAGASQVTELGLALALVVYSMAQYRLLSLTAGVLPPDPLRPKAKPLSRPGGAIGATELPGALLVAVAAVLTARFLWEVMKVPRPPWGIPEPAWRVALIVWALTAILLGLFAVIGYIGWQRQSADEAALFLRDALWAETRREQRRIQRWAAWAGAKAKGRDGQ